MAHANSLRGDLEMFGQFKNNPRIKVILKKNNFSLSFLSTEPADVAMYICGAQGYEQLHFGNGSKLIFEDTAGECEITLDYIKANQSFYLKYAETLSVTDYYI